MFYSIYFVYIFIFNYVYIQIASRYRSWRHIVVCLHAVCTEHFYLAFITNYAKAYN